MTLKQSISRLKLARVFARGWRWLPAAMLVLLAACDANRGLQITAEIDEPHYRRGTQMLRSGQNQLALEAFLKVIDKRGGDAPESHLEAGRIYLTHMKDPIAAIYHFRKHLELRPNSPQESQVRQLIDTATKEFARMLPAQPLEGQVERLDLVEMVDKLRAENTQLRAELERSGRAAPANSAAYPATNPRPAPARSATTAAPQNSTLLADTELAEPVVPIDTPPAVETARPPQRPAAGRTPTRPAAAGNTYVVQPRDTLRQISSKVYGTPTRYMDIFNANRDRLSDPNALKVGMELRIP